MTGAGLKKCSPRTRSGVLGRAPRSPPTDSALVFVARMTSGAAAASSVRKMSPLERRGPRRAASMTISASPPAPSSDRARGAGARAGRRPSRRSCRRRGRARAARRARPSRMRSLARSIAASSTSWSDHLVTGLQGDLGDPGAHRPGADDADPFGDRPRSDRLDGFERLAAGAAVEDRPALGRAEDVLDHDRAPNRSSGQRTVAGGATGGAMPGGARARPGRPRRDPVGSSTAPRRSARPRPGGRTDARRSATAAG